jgi:hypothetical protein
MCASLPASVARLVAGLTMSIALFAPMQAIAAAGDLDATFGGTGLIKTFFSGLNGSFGTALMQQSDGKLLAAGYTSAPSATDDQLVLARYTADGAADTSRTS